MIVINFFYIGTAAVCSHACMRAAQAAALSLFAARAQNLNICDRDRRVKKWWQPLLENGCTKSLVKTNLFYTNLTNTHFQKVPIPNLTRTMKQKFLH